MKVSLFSSIAEVRSAFDSKALDLHAKIKVRIDGVIHETTTGRILLWEIIPGDTLLSMDCLGFSSREQAEGVLEELKKGRDYKDVLDEASRGDDPVSMTQTGILTSKEFQNYFQVSEIVLTQLYGLLEGQYSDLVEYGGRFNIFRVDERKVTIPFELLNRLMDKGAVRGLVDYAYRNIGLKETVILADRLKDIGYRYSTLGGLSICIDDMIIPDGKWDIIRKSEDQVQGIKQQYAEGLITQGEKYNKVVDIWAKSTDDIADAMMAVMKNPGGPDAPDDILNAVYMMADSGARGSKDQMRQLAGMRGLMAKPSGEIIETPHYGLFS